MIFRGLQRLRLSCRHWSRIWKSFCFLVVLWTPCQVHCKDGLYLIPNITTGTATDDQMPLDDPHLSAGITQDLSSNHSCTCHSSHKSSKIPTSCRNTHPHDPSENCGARIFYLIGIHNQRTLDDALHLFRAIRDARNTILIHFDTKFGLKAYHNSSLMKEIEACPCGSHVEVASVHNCKWGSWSMNLPTLWSMEKAVTQYSGRWDVYINLSGDTLPVYTQDRMAELFAGPLKGINFVTSVVCETGLRPTPVTAFRKGWHKRGHYTHRPPHNLDYIDDDGVKHHNVNITTYFGSQWMSLTLTWCEFIIRQLQRPDSLPSRYRDWLIKTEKLMSDETFFSTMLMYSAPETLPNITEDFFLDRDDIDLMAIRYERMDEHVPSSSGWFPTDQRYEVPESSGVEQPRPWGPYFLGVYDLANIRDTGALFVRKVAHVIDYNMYHILPVDEPEQIPWIGWPKEVEVTDVPDWEATLAKYKTRALHKAKVDQAKKEGGEAVDEDDEGASKSESTLEEDETVKEKNLEAKEGL